MATPHTTAERLSRDAAWAAGVSAWLQTVVGTDVDLDALERRFRYRHGPVEVEGGLRRDPLETLALQQEVSHSLTRFLAELRDVCALLPGLEPTERLPGAPGAVAADRACRLLHNRLTVECDRRSVAAAAAELRVESAELGRRRLQQQLVGIRALQQLCAAVRAELTAQIDELRGTQLAMLSAFATAWPLLKQHEPLSLPSLVPKLQLVLPRAVAANATEADARVGALLQENARLKREARIAEADDILTVKGDEEAPLALEETKESPVEAEVVDEEPSPPPKRQRAAEEEAPPPRKKRRRQQDDGAAAKAEAAEVAAESHLSS